MNEKTHRGRKVVVISVAIICVVVVALFLTSRPAPSEPVKSMTQTTVVSVVSSFPVYILPPVNACVFRGFLRSSGVLHLQPYAYASIHSHILIAGQGIAGLYIELPNGTQVDDAETKIPVRILSSQQPIFDDVLDARLPFTSTLYVSSNTILPVEVWQNNKLVFPLAMTPNYPIPASLRVDYFTDVTLVNDNNAAVVLAFSYIVDVIVVVKSDQPICQQPRMIQVGPS